MTLGPRPYRALALPAIAGALLTLAQPAKAQQDAAKAQGLERAQKAADAVFHWIKLNADKGASRQQPAPAPTPAPPPAPKKPAPVAAAPKPAPAQPLSATAPTPATAEATTPAVTANTPPEPEPVVLAAAAPTPPPDAPLAAAAQAVEPPPPAASQNEPDEPLRLMSKVEPVLPRQMQQGGFSSGFAQVQFTVAPNGTVQNASVIKTSHSRLGTAAVDAVRQWRFAPIRKARDVAVEVAFRGDDE